MVSKVLERCIYNQLIVHVSCQLHHLQFGFLRVKSTTSQLRRVLNEINKALGELRAIGTIYLDFAEAFDKVDHILLLKKTLKVLSLNWFNNYLSNRLQKVTVLGSHSSSQPLPVLSGVPQGPHPISSSLSTICPIRFPVNHPLLYSLTTRSRCYRSVTRVSDCGILQSDLHNLVQWCSNWKMKCAVSHKSRNYQLIHYGHELLRRPIKVVDAQKILGLSLHVILNGMNIRRNIVKSKQNAWLRSSSSSGYQRRPSPESPLSVISSRMVCLCQ